MKRAFATLAAAAAVAGIPIMSSSTASAVPGLCTDTQRCMDCIRHQSFGNCAEPDSNTLPPTYTGHANADGSCTGFHPLGCTPPCHLISPLVGPIANPYATSETGCNDN